MKKMMYFLLILSCSSTFAADLKKGPCDVAASKKAEKLRGEIRVYETFIDKRMGNIEQSGILTYLISTGNGEDGFGQYTVVVKQTLRDEGSVQCRILSAK